MCVAQLRKNTLENHERKGFISSTIPDDSEFPKAPAECFFEMGLKQEPLQNGLKSY